MEQSNIIDTLETYQHVIYFCDEATQIAKHGPKDKHKPIAGMPVVSVKIGDHCYHG